MDMSSLMDYFSYRQHYHRSSVGFLESFFSFVFGDGNPNEGTTLEPYDHVHDSNSSRFSI
jgi:hypothetical protein